MSGIPAPLDQTELKWRDNVFLQQFPLNQHTVLDYFSRSDFYDEACNNAECRRQGLNPDEALRCVPMNKSPMQACQMHNHASMEVGLSLQMIQGHEKEKFPAGRCRQGLNMYSPLCKSPACTSSKDNTAQALNQQSSRRSTTAYMATYFRPQRF